MYGRLLAGKVATLEDAVQRADEARITSAIAALQRAALFVAERHAQIAASVRAQRAVVLAALLDAWREWAALESRDVLAAVATTQRTADGLAQLRAQLVVPAVAAGNDDEWRNDV